MRWIAFVIFLYFFGAMGFARLGALRPFPAADPVIEYLPLLGVFYALYADEDQAALAGFWCGLLYDLLSSEPVGVSTLALALVCYGVVRIRLSIFRELWLSQLVIVFLAVFCFGVVSGALRAFLPWLLVRPGVGVSFWSITGAMAANALYTAAIAPLVFWVLFRFQGLLRFHLKSGRNR